MSARLRIFISSEVLGVNKKPHPPGIGPQPGSLKDRVLRLMIANAVGKAEISLALGQKEVSGQLNKIIRELLAENRIEYTIPEKPNSPQQKYRLSDKGRAWLAGRTA